MIGEKIVNYYYRYHYIGINLDIYCHILNLIKTHVIILFLIWFYYGCHNPSIIFVMIMH